MAKRKLIGIIINSLDGDYEKSVADYLRHSSVGANVNLLFFSGSDLALNEDGSHPYQTIYDLPNMKMLDGLILVLSPMIHHFSSTVFDDLIKRIAQVPKVSLSIPIEGALNILLDNTYAMTEIMGHMKTHHSLKEICYIGGPSHNNEALVRTEVYKNMLKASGLTMDEACFYEGDFQRQSGMAAVDYFIEKHGGVPKAIVAANDHMAIGAYKRLSQLGFSVPSDVAISGFDNIGTSADFFPALTTYDQHMEKMCEVAFSGLMQLIDGEIEPKTIHVRGELVVRDSCGCPDALGQVQQGSQDQELLKSKVNPLELKVFSDQLYRSEAMAAFSDLMMVTMMATPYQQKHLLNYSALMIKRLLIDLEAQQIDGQFLSCVGKLVNQSIITDGGGDLSNLGHGLRQHFMTRTSDEGIRQWIDAMLRAAEKLIQIGLRRQEKSDYFNFRQMYMMSRNITRDLNNVLSSEEIYQILEKNLPYYGIDQCYVVQYKRPIDFTANGHFIYPMMSDMVFAYENGQSRLKQSFMTNNMLPTDIIYNDGHQGLLFLGLHTGSTYYGYMVFGINGIDGLIYETIRSQISEAIKSQQLNMKRLEADRALNNVLKELELSNDLLRWQSVRDVLTGLYNRRGFYQEAEAYYRGAEPKKEAFFVIFGDIDGLKQINDRYGHNEGDYAIQQVGRALESGLPQNAILARMSGDEFTAVVGGIDDPSVIEGYLDKIQKDLDLRNEEGDKPYHMAISLGYAAYDYGQLNSMDDVLRMADSHLYRKKKRKQQ